MKVLIARAEHGKVVEKLVVEDDLEKALKDTVIKVLQLWNPKDSDLIIMRHKQEVVVKLPISREQYEAYSQYNLRRKGDAAVFEVPLYLISYENRWVNDDVVDSKVYVVSPYVDEVAARKVLELAENVTAPLEQKEEEEEEES